MWVFDRRWIQQETPRALRIANAHMTGTAEGCNRGEAQLLIAALRARRTFWGWCAASW